MLGDSCSKCIHSGGGHKKHTRLADGCCAFPGAAPVMCTLFPEFPERKYIAVPSSWDDKQIQTDYWYLLMVGSNLDSNRFKLRFWIYLAKWLNIKWLQVFFGAMANIRFLKVSQGFSCFSFLKSAWRKPFEYLQMAFECFWIEGSMFFYLPKQVSR